VVQSVAQSQVPVAQPVLPSQFPVVNQSVRPTQPTQHIRAFVPIANQPTQPVQRIFVPVTPMPVPGQPRAPLFTGKDVTEFLRAYDSMAEDHSVSGQVKWARLPRYLDVSIREQVRAMPEYAAGATNFAGYNEAAFYSALKDEFARWDWEQIQLSEEYLRVLVDSVKTGRRVSLRLWIQDFGRVATPLLNSGQIDQSTACRLFIQGLPSMRKQLFRRTAYFPGKPRTYNFRGLFECALRLCSAKEREQEWEESVSPARTLERINYISSVYNELTSRRIDSPPTPFQ